MNSQDLEAEMERLHPSSYGWALALCAWDRAEAEEALQTSYLKVFDGRARFEGRSSLKTWLYGVIRKTVAERRRRRLLGLKALAALFQGDAGRSQQGPEEAACGGERRAAVLSRLRNLPARQREVLDLVFYQGLTIEEAAEVMGVSLGTARVHYERGKRRLREELGALSHEFA